jgi:hypothetical protein
MIEHSDNCVAALFNLNHFPLPSAQFLFSSLLIAMRPECLFLLSTKPAYLEKPPTPFDSSTLTPIGFNVSVPLLGVTRKQNLPLLGRLDISFDQGLDSVNW